MSRRAGAVIVAFALVCAGCDWFQWGNGGGHAGNAVDPAITKQAVAGFVASPMASLPATGEAVTSNGLVFVVRDGTLTALDATTSEVVWTAALPAGSTAGGTPAINSGARIVFVVVAAASNPILEGFDVDGVRNCNTILATCSPMIVAGVGSAAGPATPPVTGGTDVFVNGGASVFAFDAGGRRNCVAAFGTQVCSPTWSAPTGLSVAGLGPALGAGTLYDAVDAGGPAIRAFDAGSGAPLWTGPAGAATATPSIGGDDRVFLPAGNVIRAFPGAGCGASTCAPSFTLAQRTGDPTGSFLGTPAFDGTTVYATNANGTVSAWPESGCGTSACQPTLDVTVNTPTGGSTTYAQSPAVAGGMLFLLTRRPVSGTDHTVLVALDDGSGHQLATWDLGTAGFGAGLANPSIANGVVYAPTAAAVFALHRPPVDPLASLTTSPLALSPAFSPTIHDYVVRCAAGANSLTLGLVAVSGGSVGLTAPITTQPSASQNVGVSLAENQAAVVQATDAQGASSQYWVRCLPHDFPVISVTRHPENGAPTPGWYLIGNTVVGTGNSPYAMIVDGNGTPVWYRRSTQGGVINVTALDRDVVAFAAEAGTNGFGSDPNAGFDVYDLDTGGHQFIKGVGVPTDFHELHTLPNGDHMVLAYPFKTGVDLTGLAVNPPGGPNSTIADCVVQEVDPQGNLVWQWRASDHIDPVQESTFANAANFNGQTIYDVYHCNSIDTAGNGDVLLSARHTDAVFRISRSTGTIIWKLGGTAFNKDGAQHIQVQNDAEHSFFRQHDARFAANGDITLYDDQTFAVGPARGIEYALDLGAGTAQPVFQVPSPGGVQAAATGSFRRFRDGESVVGWGIISATNGLVFTEANAAGQDVMDLSFAPGAATYRALKEPIARFDVNALRRTAGQ